MPDNTLSTLTQIRVKVRRLTRSPSTNQLTNAQIDDYVNTFILYDMPEHLRLFNRRQPFTFYTQPNIDTYSTVNAPTTDPLFNFNNEYLTVHPPVYIGGRLSWFSQDREEFFIQYPLNNFEQTIGTGNGVTTVFTGTATNLPILRNNVTITSQDVNGNPLTLVDVPTAPQTANLVIPNQAVVAGTLNYITGVFNFDYNTVGLAAPSNGTLVTLSTRPYQASWPHALLYFNDTFTLRPVPDKAYPVRIEVYRRPTEMLLASQEPNLAQWWQYVAYGSAKKVFEDRMDMESVRLITPEYKQQERLVLRRTIVQQTNERVATLYTDQTNNNAGGRNGGFGQF